MLAEKEPDPVVNEMLQLIEYTDKNTALEYVCVCGAEQCGGI